MFFIAEEDISYTLELKNNADTGVTITKKINGGNSSEDDSMRNGDIMSNAVEQYQYSFKNSMEFRCITQQVLDILKMEEEKLSCTRTCKYTYK